MHLVNVFIAGAAGLKACHSLDTTKSYANLTSASAVQSSFVTEDVATVSPVDDLIESSIAISSSPVVDGASVSSTGFVEEVVTKSQNSFGSSDGVQETAVSGSIGVQENFPTGSVGVQENVSTGSIGVQETSPTGSFDNTDGSEGENDSDIESDDDSFDPEEENPSNGNFGPEGDNSFGDNSSDNSTDTSFGDGSANNSFGDSADNSTDISFGSEANLTGTSLETDNPDDDPFGPENTDTPVEPDNSDTPEPDTSETPEPDNSDTPVQPDNSDPPVQPDNSDTPVEPSGPDSEDQNLVDSSNDPDENSGDNLDPDEENSDNFDGEDDISNDPSESGAPFESGNDSSNDREEFVSSIGSLQGVSTASVGFPQASVGSSQDIATVSIGNTLATAVESQANTIATLATIATVATIDSLQANTLTGFISQEANTFTASISQENVLSFAPDKNTAVIPEENVITVPTNAISADISISSASISSLTIIDHLPTNSFKLPMENSFPSRSEEKSMIETSTARIESNYYSSIEPSVIFDKERLFELKKRKEKQLNAWNLGYVKARSIESNSSIGLTNHTIIEKNNEPKGLENITDTHLTVMSGGNAKYLKPGYLIGLVVIGALLMI